MKPNEIRRRDIIAGMALIPAASLLPPASAEWKPNFFTPEQAELVATVAEVIIPETDTPGARAARVHEYIDLVLKEETPEHQKSFLQGLASLNKKSRKQHGQDFVKLSSEQQTAILTAIQTTAFFDDIRHRTVFGYYTSKIGLIEELNYQGNQAYAEWPGCPHPDHHGDPEEAA